MPGLVLRLPISTNTADPQLLWEDALRDASSEKNINFINLIMTKACSIKLSIEEGKPLRG